eukprot:Phypoly_transcript_00744.p1 GENE.Phypoly_transcript_00744~~Phypoly_transcript_00744.p1  ORF type:complete len:811 (+),score=221.20 Phypoly_transcript_00744:175-2433(+)
MEEAPEDFKRDEDYSEPRSSTRARNQTVKKKKSPIKTKSGRTVRRIAHDYDSEEHYSSSSEDDDEQVPELGSDEENPIDVTPKKANRAVTWTTVVERNTPEVASYVPQLGDLVMYFYQGHEKYKERFPDSLRDPKTILTGLPPMQECKVISIVYRMNPNSHAVYATITLAPTQANSTVTFQVNYHASEEPDYLVLSSRFRHTMRNQHLWQPSRHFRMYYPDKREFYFGEVKQIGQAIPDSWWEALDVAWLDGTSGDVSPWEIEPIEKPNTTTSYSNNINNNNNNNNNSNTNIHNNNFDDNHNNNTTHNESDNNNNNINDNNNNNNNNNNKYNNNINNNDSNNNDNKNNDNNNNNSNNDNSNSNNNNNDNTTTTNNNDNTNNNNNNSYSTNNTTNNHNNNNATEIENNNVKIETQITPTKDVETPKIESADPANPILDEQIDIDDTDQAAELPFSKWVVARDYEESKADFEEELPTGERERILAILREVFETDWAENFREPVNLRKNLHYRSVCPHPIDLSMIIARLENNYYRRVDAVLYDLKLMHRNAYSYNQPDSAIVKCSRIIYRQIVNRINGITTSQGDDEAPLVDIENLDETEKEEIGEETSDKRDSKGKGKGRSKSRGKTKVEEARESVNYNDDVSMSNYGEGSSNGATKHVKEKEKENEREADISLEDMQLMEAASGYSLRSRAPSTINENITVLKQNKPTPKIVVKLKGVITNGLTSSTENFSASNPSNSGRDESALSREQVLKS